MCASTGEFWLDVDLTVEPGDLIAFHGASGAGKTTLLRLIAGLAEADSGTIRVGERCWLDSTKGLCLPARKREVGFVFQDYALFPNMCVWENLAFAQPVRNLREVNELLDLFELTGLADAKPQQLSGGQQQRVALARALLRKPRLLLLDEPLFALDSSMRSDLQAEILRIHKRWGITTILVSHDLSEIFKLCNRVVTLKEGRVVADGAPYSVFGQHRTSGKLQFLAEVIAVEREDIVTVLTLLVGNTPAKVACSSLTDSFSVGDKVWIMSKAFNPIIEKVKT